MTIAADLDALQRARRAFQQNPTPSLSSVIRRLSGQIRRNPAHKEMLMHQELADALAAYRKALLETAFADMAAIKCGTLRGPGVAQAAMEARARVMAASRKLTATEFTAACMAAGFIL